jgi:DNA polymerase I
MSKPKKLFIIDAMAMAFRNYHAFGQRPLMTSSGIHTSAVFGSSMFMTKLIEDEKPDLVIVATDSKEKTFRHEMYKEYKANRTEMPEDLADQLPFFFELFSAMGIPVLRQPGVEADDIIGSICKQFASPETHCFIVSGDKDFMQLVGPNVSLYSPKKNEPALLIQAPGVFEKFGCKPEQVIDVLALIGDTSDNVPGVHGIGEKGASKLISEFHNLEGIYKNIDSISNVKLKNALQNDRDSAFLSRLLVTIKTDLDLDVSPEDMLLNKDALANQRLLDLYTKLEFRGLSAKMKERLASQDEKKIIAPSKESSALSPDISSGASIESNVDHSRAKSGTHYLIANTPELVIRLIQELNNTDLFSFDTETTGLDRIEDTPIGISFSTRSGYGWYLPLVKKHLTGWLTPEFIRQQIEPILHDPNKTKVAHNLKFDVQMLNNVGIEVSGPFGDTMLASYVINPISKEHGLDSCAMERLNFKKIPTKALMGDDFERSMLDVPLEDLATYACEDADVVYQLNEIYQSILSDMALKDVYQNIDVPLAPVLAAMEKTGVHIDSDALAEISTKLDKRAKQLEQLIYKEAGEEFNINSPKQLQVILFDKMAIHSQLGITRLKKTKSGFSTDVSVMESLSAHPLPRAILEYRTVTKLKNTYVDALPQLLHPKTGRVHTNFHQTGTATGRLSSSDPNLQNIPIRKEEGREIRKAFSASAPDRKIISADYSQIELRLLAHISDDHGLKSAFASDQDIHTATASKIFGIPPEKVTPDLRSNAKAINFGIIYGMGPQRLARETGVSMAEAKTFIEKYFDGFPKIRDYIDAAKRAARELGYSTTMTGRRRPIPEINSKDRAVMINGENMAVNSPIQGSAADLVKIAMINTQKQLIESGLEAKMLLQVHDELVFESKDSDVEAVKALVKSAMETAMKLSVPLKVEVGAGMNWLEAHS